MSNHLVLREVGLRQFTCIVREGQGMGPAEDLAHWIELSRSDGPGVCLGDGQTEDEEVPSQGGRGEALLRLLT